MLSDIVHYPCPDVFRLGSAFSLGKLPPLHFLIIIQGFHLKLRVLILKVLAEKFFAPVVNAIIDTPEIQKKIKHIIRQVIGTFFFIEQADRHFTKGFRIRKKGIIFYQETTCPHTGNRKEKQL